MELALKIVNLLAKGGKHTINEIAKKLQEYYSFVHRVVNKLVKDGVLRKEAVGRAYLCSLQWSNEKVIPLLQLAEIEKRSEFYNKNKEIKLLLEDFIAAATAKDAIFSIILFGSYAKGTPTKESDIDILLLAKGKIEITKITKEIYAKYGREINAIIMTPKEFEQQKDKALIKEIREHHYVLYGVDDFMKLTREK